MLVVDDEASIRGFLGRALEREGLVPVEAATGTDAIARFDESPPHLVLLDVHLPDRSGFSVCEEIRSRSVGAEIPIVMMTGGEDPEEVRLAFESGATDFATKPIPWMILSHRLRYLLRAASTLRELRASEERLKQAQVLALIGSWELEFDGTFRGSDAFWEILGHGPGGTTGARQLAHQIHPEDQARVLHALQRCREQGVGVRFDHRLVRLDGAERILHCQVQLGTDEHGDPCRFVGTSQDLTERKRTEEQVRFLISHDPLTSLGNRRLFRERLDLAVQQARHDGTRTGVMHLDLDHFKRINETFSHSVGDSLLREVAHRLLTSVRGGDLVSRDELAADGFSAISRFGGDEFTILIPNVRDEQDLAMVARRLLDSLRRPFLLEGHEVVVAGSLGISVFPTDGETPEELLRNADTAMYAAKSDGRDTYRFYTQSMNERSLHRFLLESRLRRAIDESQFRLYYQPKVCLRSGRVTGFEGLLRWSEPELGLIGPDDFIPVAEETGLIGRLGEWVIGEACRQVALWARDHAFDMCVAINLSPEQFREPGLGDRIAQAARDAGADPTQIELEITESVVLHDAEQVIREIAAIRGLGMRVALDDFGTGYSSLSYLHRLPVDTLKIDRAFILDIEKDPDDAALTRGIIAMARAIGVRTVAEGVETASQRELLAGWDCDEMQGYFFSRPVPADEALELWRRTNHAGAPPADDEGACEPGSPSAR